MAKLLERLMFWRGREDRRTKAIPVANDRRRKKMSIKEVDQKLGDAMDNLERTIRMKRDDFFNERVAVANDIQTVVVFKTFAEICRFRGSDSLTLRICRNERHQDAANSALAICNEEKCPLILEALKGAA